MGKKKFQFHNTFLRYALIVLAGISILLFPAVNSYAVSIDYGNVSLKRIYGSDRYETAEKIADELLNITGQASFDSIVIASGENFPDALSGSYLAKCSNAPILLVSPQTENEIADYIRSYLTASGTVYILGGAEIVKESFSALIAQERPDASVERIYGADRYYTNLEVLDATDVTGGTIIVTTGANFPDALCASSSGYPILLVDDELNTEQLTFLNTLSDPNFVIVGGTGVVNPGVEEILSGFGVTTRLCSSTRYSTSAAFAEWSKGSDVSCAVVAVGDNFPDALVAGPVAYTKGASILLASNSSNIFDANKYLSQYDICDVMIIGGDTLVSDQVAEFVWEGVDVSAYQDEIDWESVKSQGVKFAMIRLGGRYGASGELYSDGYAAANLQGAKAQGIKIGAYFFTQAITEQEAIEEADFAVQMLDGIDLDFPIAIDTEYPGEGYRHSNISASQRTKVVKAFCDRIIELGY